MKEFTEKQRIEIYSVWQNIKAKLTQDQVFSCELNGGDTCTNLYGKDFDKDHVIYWAIQTAISEYDFKP